MPSEDQGAEATKASMVKAFRHEVQASSEHLVFSLLFENSAETADVVAMGHLEGRVNYLKGNNKSKWNINIPTFRETLYKGIYEGIDLRIYGNGQSLEYDFIVNPGADPGKIQLASEGIKGLIINHEGYLLIRTPFGRLKVSKPSIYQEIEGKRVEVAGKRDAFVIKMAGDEKGNVGSIDGYVYSKSFEPIASATVKLKDIITKEQEKRITENNGFFIFTNLESGTYNLKAKKGKKKVESELITLSEEDPNVRVVLVLD